MTSSDFIANKLSGLRQGKPTEGEQKTADHVMVDILGALIRALSLLIACVIVANLLFGYPLQQAETLGIASVRGLAILVGVWFLGSWLGSRVRKFGQKLGRARPHAQRSVGTPDPGAISMAMILRAVGEVLTRRAYS